MHVVDGAAAGLLVQVVDVLGAEEEAAAALGERGLGPGERGVGGVRARGEQVAAAQVVEVVHAVRVAGEGLGRRELHRVELRPDAARVAEGAEAALGRDPGAGQDEELHAGAGANQRGRTASSRARSSGSSAASGTW